MDWTEIRIKVKSKDLEKAEDISNMVVPYGIYVEDYSDLENEVESIAHVNLIDEELLAKDREHGIIHIYFEPDENVYEAIAFLTERFNEEKIEFEVEKENVEEDDWLNKWRQYFTPMEIGKRLLINPSWLDCKETERKVLSIDPGLAFGTGKHETTKLCLEAIEENLNEGDEVLDVGCGSGILSIAALLLGAGKAVGVDIDEMAVKTAKENGTLNGVGEKFSAVCGDLVDKIEEKYDIVVANIVADAIISLSENIESFMKDDALYIVSGIIDTRKDDVIQAVSKKFEIVETKKENNWYCFVLKIKK